MIDSRTEDVGCARLLQNSRALLCFDKTSPMHLAPAQCSSLLFIAAVKIHRMKIDCFMKGEKDGHFN